MIELPLDLAQCLVVDLAVVTKLDHRESLRCDDRTLDLLVLEELAPSSRLAGIVGREMPAAITESRLEPVQERLVRRPVWTDPLDFVEARLVGDRPSEAASTAPGPMPSQPTCRRTNGSVSPWPTKDFEDGLRSIVTGIRRLGRSGGEE